MESSKSFVALVDELVEDRRPDAEKVSTAQELGRWPSVPNRTMQEEAHFAASVLWGGPETPTIETLVAMPARGLRPDEIALTIVQYVGKASTYLIAWHRPTTGFSYGSTTVARV